MAMRIQTKRYDVKRQQRETFAQVPENPAADTPRNKVEWRKNSSVAEENRESASGGLDSMNTSVADEGFPARNEDGPAGEVSVSEQPKKEGGATASQQYPDATRDTGNGAPSMTKNEQEAWEAMSKGAHG